MLEVFNEPNRVTYEIDGLQVDIVTEPLLYYSIGERLLLAEQISRLLSSSLNGERLSRQLFDYSIFGEPKKGKILTTVKGAEHDLVQGVISGQMINDGDKPISFGGEKVFHISVISSSSVSFLRVWGTLIHKLRESAVYQPDYFSCFTQNPRVYSLLRYFSNLGIYPNHSPRPKDRNLEARFIEVTSFLNKGEQIENGVFKGRAKISFTKDRQLSLNEGVNSWFYGSLNVVPEQGDVLLLLGKVKV